MSDGSNERYPSVALKNGAISIFTKIKGIEVVRNTNELSAHHTIQHKGWLILHITFRLKLYL